MIIGIGGKIGHGKDTIADFLVRAYGFKIVRMSDALKEEVLTRLPRTLTTFWSVYNPERPVPTPALLRDMVFNRKPYGVRELLQEYGTEVRRADDPDYWVRRWAEEAVKYRHVVAPDVRFFNEAKIVRDLGGKLWHVDRPGMPETGDHASEQFAGTFDGWDTRFTNDGSIADLEGAVNALLLAA